MKPLLSQLLSKVNSSQDVSKLYDEGSFYPAFLKDLNKCGAEVLIESPFITSRRVDLLLPTLRKLKKRRVKVALITRDPFTCEDKISRIGSLKAISELQKIGVQVAFSKGLHRKLAILDRNILYEGSLNIMSQSNSQEIMRRIESVKACWQMIGFTKVDRLVQ